MPHRTDGYSKPEPPGPKIGADESDDPNVDETDGDVSPLQERPICSGAFRVHDRQLSEGGARYGTSATVAKNKCSHARRVRPISRWGSAMVTHAPKLRAHAKVTQLIWTCSISKARLGAAPSSRAELKGGEKAGLNAWRADCLAFRLLPRP